MSLSFNVEGLHCESCLKVIPMILGRVPGVTKVAIEPVNATEGHVVLESDTPIEQNKITEALAAYHYSPTFDE